MKYVEVVLPLPLDGLFTYAVADNQAAKAQVGCRVLVPLGKSKKYIGIVMHVVDEKPEFEVKPIIEVIDRQPILLHQQIRLWQWISDYYLSPLGDIYKAALPSGLKAEEGYRPKKETYITLSEAFRSEQTLHVAMNMLTRATKQLKAFVGFLSLSHWDTLNGTTPQETLTEITREELMNATNTSLATVKALVDRDILTLYQKEVGRLNTSETAHPECMKPLSTAQSTAFEAVNELFATKKVVLLQGVTSSGKTEIYIHLIQQALDRGEQVLYLLPEIALTVQITSRLKKVFGNRLGIYHSKYSDAERVEMWNKQLSNAPYEVILGARSAVFLPFQKLGLVIVDEEHETSFKQQDPAPRYHARSAAIVLASMYQAKTLLGTATPSLESYYNAQQGKYGLVPLTTRFKGIQLPQIEVVDTKDLQRRKMMTGR